MEAYLAYMRAREDLGRGQDQDQEDERPRPPMGAEGHVGISPMGVPLTATRESETLCVFLTFILIFANG